MSRKHTTDSSILASDDFTAHRGGDALVRICSDLRHLLADAFALYLKTKNFHWHIR